MFKKFLSLLICLYTMFFMNCAFADELEDVQKFFDNYVQAANSYSKTVVDYYLPNANIVRVVLKPDGTTQSVNFPMERYKKELKKGQPLARL